MTLIGQEQPPDLHPQLAEWAALAGGGAAGQQLVDRNTRQTLHTAGPQSAELLWQSPAAAVSTDTACLLS